jgi:hypothetical protein
MLSRSLARVPGLCRAGADQVALYMHQIAREAVNARHRHHVAGARAAGVLRSSRSRCARPITFSR